MKKLLIILIACTIPLTATYACMAFFKYERTSGLNKICFYDHLGSEVAMTVRNIDLCPLNIQVSH